MKQFGMPIVALAIVAVMIGLFVIGNKGGSAVDTAAARVGVKHDDQGSQHINPGDQHEAYNSDLPSSGPHYSPAAPWGIKAKEIADETLIHNLEHGGVVITYRPDLPQDQVSQLTDLFGQLPQSTAFNSVKAVLAPRTKNAKAIQLAAWTYTLNLETLDKAKITEFYSSHLDKGPELVP